MLSVQRSMLEPRAPVRLKSLCCAVMSLGRINWINPAFHNEKGLWPVGFVSQRRASTPAGGKQPVPHRCEVLEDPRTGAPQFRRASAQCTECTWSCPDEKHRCFAASTVVVPSLHERKHCLTAGILSCRTTNGRGSRCVCSARAQLLLMLHGADGVGSATLTCVLQVQGHRGGRPAHGRCNADDGLVGAVRSLPARPRGRGVRCAAIWALRQARAAAADRAAECTPLRTLLQLAGWRSSAATAPGAAF